jgi:hypothetical protein
MADYKLWFIKILRDVVRNVECSFTVGAENKQNVLLSGLTDISFILMAQQITLNRLKLHVSLPLYHRRHIISAMTVALNSTFLSSHR